MRQPKSKLARPRTAVVSATIPMTLWTFHRELLRQLREQGYDLLVITGPGGDLARLGQTGVRTRPIAMSREISPISDARGLLRWLVVLKRERPALVVTATPKASLLGQVAARLTGVPDRLYYVGGLRLEGASGLARVVLTAMERLTGACASDIVVNSPSLLALCRSARLFAPAKVRSTIPASSHGVDSDRLRPGPPDPALQAQLGIDPTVPVVVFVGRLTHDKGIDTLVAALVRIRGRGRAVQLLVVGPVDEPDSQRYLVALRSALPDVITTGRVDDVGPYFRLAAIHVLPSLREGFPNVVLEASACGLPTVTTTATGCVDSVLDGHTGFTVPPQDAEALAARLEGLLSDPVEAASMGVAARVWVAKEFVPESVVASLLGPRRAAGIAQRPGDH